MINTFLEISIISVGIILSTVSILSYRGTKEVNHFIGIGMMFLSLLIINFSQLMAESTNDLFPEEKIIVYDESGFREGKDFFNRDLIITTKTLARTGDTLLIDTILGCEKDIYSDSYFHKSIKEDKRYINDFGGDNLYAVIPRSLRTNDTLFVEGIKLDTIYNARGQKFFKIQHYHSKSFFDSEIYRNVIYWKKLNKSEKL